MKTRKVIIIGSSRGKGNTTKIADEIARKLEMDIINLSDYDISHYDYESKNIDDDFLPLIRRIIENYDTFIFATPVYWYSMSGVMKVFFDRFSDLLRIEKETGRKLRGKQCAVVSNSHGHEIDADFYLPFKRMADYLGIEYLGHKHYNADAFVPNQDLELAFI